MSEFLNMRWSPELKKGILELCRLSRRNGKMIEIGSYIGDSTLLFARKFKRVYAIDPFQNHYDVNDKASEKGNMNEVYNEFKRRTENNPRITHFRLTSDAFIASHRLIVDLVYIDGIHTYEQVKKDIVNYLPLVAKGGIIAGHDYSWDGVRKAVNETLGIPHGHLSDDSWYFRR